MPRRTGESNLPEKNVPEIKEGVRIRIPGSFLETDEEGYVRVPQELLQKLLDNLPK